jgi:hypothetical protein
LYPHTRDIVDMAIQVGGAKEGQSIVLKIKRLNFGKLYSLHITDPLIKNNGHCKTNQIALLFLILLL